MNGTQHTTTSMMLLEAAAPLAQNPRTALAAGELIWGATVHALSAIELHPNDKHQQPRTRRDLMQIIDHITDNPQAREDLIVGLNVTQRRLHDHFYTGRFSSEQLADDINKGTGFVRHLLQIASQPQAADGSTAV